MNLIQRKTKIQRPEEESRLIPILKKNQNPSIQKNLNPESIKLIRKSNSKKIQIQEHPNPKNQTN